MRSRKNPQHLLNRRNRLRPANSAVNATVLASRRLQSKRRATRPARYRERWADWDNDLNESEPDRTLLAGPLEFGGFGGTTVGKTACD